mmetsp:Transcript_24518/g.40119  ORF Transcript_24518/g.40119 Transcript_24518/m.40119 type:complete len:96 (+) Transcript_24518:1463-1750(+)
MCAAVRRCLTSRYDEGSSNMYTSLICIAHAAMAKRWSSPPDKTLMSRSSKCDSSASRTAHPKTSLSSASERSSRSLRTFLTDPFTLSLRGMASTY